jgi:Na+/proline symporter/nitrogen-specific signal transduction histidine kinase
MSTPSVVLAVAAAYLGLLFAIAFVVDRRGRLPAMPLIYALSIAVYCSSWTFYGSVGRAAETGLDFLPIYLGPTLVFALGWVLLRRILRICKANRVTSIADFIGLRYGRSAALAALVTVVALIGSVPYIALQLKAVATTFDVFRRAAAETVAVDEPGLLDDSAFWAALILALFAILFGTRSLDATERHPGIVAAIAFESLVKLISLTAVGLFAVYAVGGGFGPLFERALADPELAGLFELNGSAAGFEWIALTLLAMAAIVCLPRQFQVTVVENADIRHLDRAIWLFPLYLLLINLFVLPIAVAGRLAVAGDGQPDLFVLTLPLENGAPALGLLAFIGGLSAGTGMIIVETVALATMTSNDLVMPALLRLKGAEFARTRDPTRLLLTTRRLTIAVLLLLGWAYMRGIGDRYALVAIGLVSFSAVAQFAPAIVLGLFWTGGNRKGALAGIAGGSLVWAYTLLLPSFALSGLLPAGFVEAGPFGIGALRPHALFGLDGLDPVTHSLFWSMTVNIGLLVGLSLATQPSSLERAQALEFARAGEAGREGADTLWRGRAALSELQSLVGRFLGAGRAEAEFAEHARRHGGDLGGTTADAELVRHAERLLAGAIGSASARVVVGSIVKEEPIGQSEVMRILDETSQVMEYSRRLGEKSRELEAATRELRAANERLRELDRMKDEFVSTVSHELRTPLTSIRSFSEILHDNPELTAEQRREFLAIVIKESERLTRLINDVLDLSKIEAGRMEWHFAEIDPIGLARDAAEAARGLCDERGVTLRLDLPAQAPALRTDPDRLTQVLLNLLSNAAKFSPRGRGEVTLALRVQAGGLTYEVTDNGPGIAEADHAAIFERFRQAGDQLTAKPEGTGLGLPICRQILDHLGGRITVESRPGAGATFRVHLPLQAALKAAE